jgi:hypothetical protein
VKRRLIIVVVTALGLCAGATAAGASPFKSTSSTGDWGCAVIRPLNQGLCFENPLPPTLPSLPEVQAPSTPA